MNIAFSSSFTRAYKKRLRNDADKQLKFIECLMLFIKDPHHVKLRTHKLTGSLQELWSFSIDYDLRVVFYFSSPNEVIFEDIGTHDEVY
jgi:mRNA-degrading endonuclease YafQ of YafQ-DinJ toxin-antitoxin module